MLRWFQEQEHCESSDLKNDNTLQGYHILSSQTVWTIEVRTNLTKKIEVKIEKHEFYIYVGVFLIQVVGDGHTKDSSLLVMRIMRLFPILTSTSLHWKTWLQSYDTSLDMAQKMLKRPPEEIITFDRHST